MPTPDPSLRPPVSRPLVDLAHGVILPALRWDGSRHAPGGSDASAEALVEAGVAGFVVFGGTADAVAALTEGLRAVRSRPLLFGADLERGAGQQFEGATPLPPAGALGAIDDPDTTRAAAELTGREARALGVDIVFAPVADVASDPDNPIVGPRAFAADADVASRHVRAWVEGARAGGALACAKHFPGHGRSSGDSHVGEVVVGADRDTLEREMAPFRAAIASGVPLIMPGHLAVPALDPSGRIATISRPMLQDVLRGDMRFRGAVVSDALLMAGAGDLESAVVDALMAGVDLLLYPGSVERAVRATVSAAEDDAAIRARLEEAAARAEALARRHRSGVASGPAGGADEGAAVGSGPDLERAAAWASASVRRVRGVAPAPGSGHPVSVVDVDDDVGGPFPPPSRAGFREALETGRHAPPAVTVVAVWADTRGWKGRAGLSDTARRALREAVEAATGLAGAAPDSADAAAADVHVVVFGGPRVVDDVPDGPTVWLAWGGEPLMQTAAAARLREPSA